MDTLRGRLPDGSQPENDDRYQDLGEDDTGRELPPAAVGQDERRMQVRAYNFWASMLEDRNFPSVEQLDPKNLPDFGPFSVLLDFTDGIEDPGIAFLGDKLAEECGAEGPIRRLGDVPRRSLLSRITDHYMQILANQAPIGFEAEFVNQRGSTILYRGILLPFASSDERIDFIYGVINWKELADQKTTDELLLEIEQVLEARPEPLREPPPLTEWADGPADDSGVLDLVNPIEPDEEAGDWPAPAFGQPDSPAPAEPADARIAEAGEEERADIPPLPSYDDFDAPVAALSDADAAMMGLADWLASARDLADRARGSEDRSRQALYDAIGRAYDFSLAADAEPEALEALLADAGLAAQARAPFTPLVKLVFGANYDKTRLAEFATVLARAHRLHLPRGTLAVHLAEAPGGLKRIVAEERRLRREANGKENVARAAPRQAIQRKLRTLAHHPLAEVPSEGSEFALLVVRRLADGEVVLLGEIAEDAALLERAAKKLVD